MTTMTRRAATVEEAIEAALQTLDVSRDKVEIDVLSHGRKGFFGIGSKEAEVKVTVIEIDKPIIKAEPESVTKKSEDLNEVNAEEHTTDSNEKRTDLEAIVETKKYLEQVSEQMGIDDLDTTYEIDGKYVRFQLESAKAALLIGKRGQTLNALQQLAQLVTNKYSNEFKVVRIDVGDYRGRREQSLQQLAERMADKAVRTSKRVQLEPMPSHERKVIHHALSNRLDIETHSEGSDPYRYMVIESIR